MPVKQQQQRRTQQRVWYQYLKNRQIQTPLFRTGEKSSSLTPLWFKYCKTSIKIFLENKIASSPIWSWHTPHFQTQLQPFSWHSAHGQLLPVLGPSCQLCDSSPAPLQQPRQVTTGNKRKLSSKAASLSLHQENFPLFSRKIVHNKYIQNQTIFLLFSHLWELLLPWPKRSQDHITIRA